MAPLRRRQERQERRLALPAHRSVATKPFPTTLKSQIGTAAIGAFPIRSAEARRLA